MNNIAYRSLLSILVALGVIGIEPAFAYLDPGTGSIILQAVIGAVAGALIAIKLYWYKLVTFLRGRNSHTGGDHPGDR